MIQRAKFERTSHRLPRFIVPTTPVKQNPIATVFNALQKVGYGKIAISATWIINSSRCMNLLRLSLLSPMVIV